MRDYKRPAGRDGGTGRIRSGNLNVYDSLSPEVARDTKMLLDTQTKNTNYMRMRGSFGNMTEEQKRITWWLSQFVRAHMRSPRKLSDKVRKFCMRVLRLKELPPLPDPFIPVGLQYLPKKPPTRKTEDDT